MFRKIWKTIRIFAVIAILLMCIPRSILPHQRVEIKKNDLDYYIKLNNKEQRLVEFKDNDEALKIKLEQLELINLSRKKFKAGQLELDILASRVANKMSKDATENNYVGHWNVAGENPYQRYAFAGGYDHVSENAFGEWSSGNFKVSSATILSKMKSGHEKFMTERAPNDGHKQTIIDKSHNYVGLGYYLSGNQFRYYEEYIDRYFEFENIPGAVKIDEPFNITVKRDIENFLYFMIIYYEKYPKALTPDEIRKKESYEDYTNDEYLKMYAWDLARYRNGTTYKIPLRFSREGLYYIQIYYDKKEITETSSMNTRGKTPASGIVIRVNK
jgi:uncharacterized protein YkwD